MEKNLVVQEAISNLLKGNNALLNNGQALMEGLKKQVPPSFSLDLAFFSKALIDANIGELMASLTDLNESEQQQIKDTAVTRLKKINIPEERALYVVETIMEAVLDVSQPIGLAAEEYYNNGCYAMDEEEYDLAIEHFSQAITKNPAYADAYVNRGLSYANKGDYYQAISDYTQAIDLAPEDDVAFYNRGQAYRNKDNYNQAISDFTQAIALNPQEDAFFYRGLSYDEIGDYDKAITDYTQVISFNPKYATVYYNRGGIYADRGEHDKAIADYTQAIAIDKEYYDAYNNRGNSYSDKGEYDKAIADFTQAIAINPKEATAYNNRGISYNDKGEYDKAITDYTQAIAIDSQFVLAYSNRGDSYIEMGEYDKAIADFKQVLLLDSNNEYAKDCLLKVQQTAKKSPTVGRNPSTMTEVQQLALDFNAMMDSLVTASGLGILSIKDKFKRDHRAIAFKCVNFEERVNRPVIPPQFAQCMPSESTLWGVPLSNDRMAVLPSLPAYEMTAHLQGGLKELFESGYRAGIYRNIKVVEPAIVSRDFKVIKMGVLKLS